MIAIIYIITFCCVCVIQRYFYKNRILKIPPLYPGALPVIGHSLMILGDSKHLWKFVQNISRTMIKCQNHVTTLKLGFYTIHAITDPEDFAKVANVCLQKHRVYDFGKPWVGDGLITAPIEICRRHRKIISRALSQQILNRFLDIFNKQAKQMVNELELESGKEPFDHSKYVRKLALENICSTAMGFQNVDDCAKIKSQYTQAVNSLTDFIIQRILKIWLHNDYIYSWSNLKKNFSKQKEIISRLSDMVINRRRHDMRKLKECQKESSKTTFKAFLDLLLELSSIGILTQKEVKEEVDTMIVAGYDTVSNALVLTLIILGAYPEVQEKVYQELQQIFNDDRDVEKEDLSKLKYMEAVIKEALRLYPPAPIILRHLDKDVKLKNYTLPAGDDCALMIYGINRHPVWGDDANHFKPERWLSPDTLPSNRNAYATFSVGKRSCIGGNYAMMSVKTSLAHVLRNYSVRADTDNLQFRLEVTLVADSGHFISLTRR